MNCPVNGRCGESNVVYKASVSKGEHVSTYIGSTQKFKERYNQHMLSFRNQAYRNSTSLSSYIWSLKESNVEYSVKWSIISKAKAYTPEQKRCHLCITEKAKILYCKDPNLINKRSEIMSKCRHQAKYKLPYYKHRNLYYEVWTLDIGTCTTKSGH